MRYHDLKDQGGRVGDCWAGDYRGGSAVEAHRQVQGGTVLRRGTQVTIGVVVLAVVVGVGSQINPEPPADAGQQDLGQVTMPLPEISPDDPGVTPGMDPELTAQLAPRLADGRDVDISNWVVHPGLRDHPVLGQVANPAGQEHELVTDTDRYVYVVLNSFGISDPPNAAQTYHGYVNQFRALGWEEVGGDGGLRLDYLDGDPASDLVAFLVLFNPDNDGRPAPTGGFYRPPACEYVEMQVYGYGDGDAYREVTVVIDYHDLGAPADEAPAWPGCARD